MITKGYYYYYCEIYFDIGSMPLALETAARTMPHAEYSSVSHAVRKRHHPMVRVCRRL